MKILYHAQGKTRKELADAISTITGAAKMYQGIPSYAYEIDCFTVDRNGNLNFDDMIDKKKIEDLLEKLDSMGFHTDPTEPTGKGPDDSASKQENIDDLVIAMPRSFFTDTALENLKKLIQAKNNIMLKVFQIDVLRMQVTENNVLFPWFTGCPDADTVKAYTHFITALCHLAKKHKRVLATEHPSINEKYDFRCFLLRLGFIGKEYREERKLLLQHLSGSSAFKNGRKEEHHDEISE
ncbi:virulence protein [uncultured Megasphaera sp.]|uniref:virulence protein n=1 Tax=uncultured Megasphaera sp. TaxID=165188 RepID=UPI0027DE43CD|nr:virulence protein [uncultured Megasphaera sp.]